MDASPNDLVIARPQGLYCPPGDFYIDPRQPVSHALVTHTHGDRLRAGNARYLAAEAGRHVILARVGPVALQTLPYGAAIERRGVRISFHRVRHRSGSSTAGAPGSSRVLLGERAHRLVEWKWDGIRRGMSAGVQVRGLP